MNKLANEQKKMTSIANENAYGAVSASLKLADKSVINKRSISAMCESGGATAVAELQAETIEVVPELPTFTEHGGDSGDEFSEYSDENDMAIEASRHSFHSNNMDDDDEEPFDEYGNTYTSININLLLLHMRVCVCVCVWERVSVEVCVGCAWI